MSSNEVFAREVRESFTVTIDGERIANALLGSIEDRLEAAVTRALQPLRRDVEDMRRDVGEIREGMTRIEGRLEAIEDVLTRPMIDPQVLQSCARERIELAQQRARREAARRASRPVSGRLVPPDRDGTLDRGVQPSFRGRRGATREYDIDAPPGLAEILGHDVAFVRHYGAAPNCGPLAAQHALGIEGDTRAIVREFLASDAGRGLVEANELQASAEHVANSVRARSPTAVEAPFFFFLAHALNRPIDLAFDIAVQHLCAADTPAAGPAAVVFFHDGTYFHVGLAH